MDNPDKKNQKSNKKIEALNNNRTNKIKKKKEIKENNLFSGGLGICILVKEKGF